MRADNLSQAARQLLEDNILPFWINKMQDAERGGFYGRMDGSGRLDPAADKGAVLNARILWTFAAAYRVLKDEKSLQAAIQAKNYIISHFIDADHGGVFWAVDCQGRPKDTKKQSYAIAFTIYGMSEFFRATGDADALRCAITLFDTLEKHAYDSHNTGYVEALTRDWQPLTDMRLSDKDENGSRTMNTHLHILEAYTNLYLAMSDAKDTMTDGRHQFPCDIDDTLSRVQSRLRTLIDIFITKIMNPQTHHLDLFFNDLWQGRRDIESYGHGIEASWLITEAIDVMNDELLTERVMPHVRDMARAAEEGLCADGAMLCEHNRTTEHTDSQRQWWVQCECVIGEINMHQKFHEPLALERALACYEYIDKNLVDHKEGEWFWSILPDGTINRIDDKAGFWKCPYHNSRMCLEIIERQQSY